MEHHTYAQTEALDESCPSTSATPSPSSRPLPKIKVTHDYLDQIYPGCLYDAESEGEERRAALKEKKRLRRLRYKANCKVRGKTTRKNDNWSVVKEILNTANEQSAEGEDNLDELAAFLDEAVASFSPPDSTHRHFEEENWEKDAQQPETVAVPLLDSDEEEHNREMAEFFADVPAECLPDIPDNAPPSPPITAADLNATVARALALCEQGRASRSEESSPLFTSKEEGMVAAASSGEKGEKDKDQNQNIAFVLPRTADAAYSKAAHCSDVTSGGERSDRNRLSMMGGLVSERPLDDSPSVLPRGRN